MTWLIGLEMVLLIACFFWLGMQHMNMVAQDSATLSRPLLMALSILLMLVVLFGNRLYPQLWAGFLVVALLQGGLTAWMQKRKPASLPKEPHF
jgi:hypothetical protein